MVPSRGARKHSCQKPLEIDVIQRNTGFTIEGSEGFFGVFLQFGGISCQISVIRSHTF